MFYYTNTTYNICLQKVYVEIDSILANDIIFALIEWQDVIHEQAPYMIKFDFKALAVAWQYEILYKKP